MATAVTALPVLDYASHKLWDGPQTDEVRVDQAEARKLAQSFPQRINGPRAWTTSDVIAQEDQWLMVLSEKDLDHVAKALRHFQSMSPLNPIAHPHAHLVRVLSWSPPN
jgi:hypothetical protein